MKRIITVFAVLMLLGSLICLPVSAENNVDSIDINVDISDDGYAIVTQVWKGSFNTGTENYIVIGNIGNRSVSLISVSDELGKYEMVNGWDVEASFSDKVRKAGIVTKSDSYELCWGISEYGSHTYTVTYLVEGLVSAFADSDGFNFMFLNPGMNIYPTDASISISLSNGKPITDEVADIWAFRYHGQIEFRSGKVFAYTTTPLKENDDSAMVVMIRLDKGLISPEYTDERKFEELKDDAVVGSDYSSDDDSFVVVFAVIMVAAVAVVILAVYIYRKRQLHKLYRSADYYRDTPQNGCIEKSFWLANSFDMCKKDTSIIGTVLLRLINSGSLVPITEKSVGFFGGEKQSVNLQLVKAPKSSDVPGSKVYNLLQKACDEDMILQEKELSKYISKNVDEPREIIKSVLQAGEYRLTNEHCFKKNAGKTVSSLSEHGIDELKQLMGLKKYLLEFSLISERTVDESVIWEDYLVYATLLDIADEVIEQFKKVYPQNLPEYSDRYDNIGYNLWLASMYSNCYTSALTKAEAARSAGSGGASSFGGGGGFSGGGFGGGSR